MEGYPKQQCLALCGQDDFAALKSIRRQKTIWMLAGQRMQPPTGESLHLFFPSTPSKDGCDVSQVGGGWQGAVLSRALSVSLVTGDKV